MAIFNPTGESSTSGQGLPIMVPIPLFFQQSEMTHGTQNSEQCSRADYKWTGVEGWLHTGVLSHVQPISSCLSFTLGASFLLFKALSQVCGNIN